MGKKCEYCGRFMKLSDLLPDDDEFDIELAIKCGLLPEDEQEAYGDFDGEWSRFRFVYDQWHCDNCDVMEDHTQGKRYYWNADSGNYDANAPLTPAEIDALERQAAGQLPLFDK